MPILPRPGISLSQCFGLISSRSCRFRPAYIRKPPLQGVTCASRGTLYRVNRPTLHTKSMAPSTRAALHALWDKNTRGRLVLDSTNWTTPSFSSTHPLPPTRSCHVPNICTRRPTLLSSTVGLDASVQDGNRDSDVRNRLHPPLPPPPRRQKYLRQVGHPSNITALSRARKAREMQSTCARSWLYRQASRPLPVDCTRSRRARMSGWCTRNSGAAPNATRDHPPMDGEACL